MTRGEGVGGLKGKEGEGTSQGTWIKDPRTKTTEWGGLNMGGMGG